MEEKAANLISDSVRPRLLPDLQILTFRNTQVLAVRVYPSPARPHFIAREGLRAGTYVRVGSTNRLADAPMIAEMERFAAGDSFDEQSLPALDSEAVDFRVASEFFAPVRKLTRRNLETLRLLTRHQGRVVPTAGGVLLFGAERLAHFPDAWIQAGPRLRVTIRSEVTGAVSVDPVERSILALLEHGAGLSTSAIAAVIGLAPRATRTRLAKLVSRGLVREVGTGPRDPRRRSVSRAPGRG